MSDDRIKEARRSLIDGDDDNGDSSDHDESDEEFSEEKTMLVDLDSLQSGGDDAEGSEGRKGDGSGGRDPQIRDKREPNREPSRGRESGRSDTDRGGGREESSRGPRERSSGRGRDDESTSRSSRTSRKRRGRDEQTRDVSMDDIRQRGRSEGGPRDRDDSETADRRRNRSDRAQNDQGRHRDPRRDGPSRSDRSGRRGDAAESSNSQSLDSSTASTSPGSPDLRRRSSEADESTASIEHSHSEGNPQNDGGRHHQEGRIASDDGQQVFVPGNSGEEKGRDEKTAFVDLDQFADEDPKTFAPEADEAGYDGNTQFVEIDSLLDSQESKQTESSEAGAIERDEVLTRTYQFDSDAIDRGEDVNLVWARNSMGKPVLLRQIWSGEGQQVPTEMRERLNELDQLQLPGLLSMNGMIITETGCWVELERPRGTRLNEILKREGALDRDRALAWSHEIGETLERIHETGLVYANLTPSAVWVRSIDREDPDEDGESEPEFELVLEPFDLLALEDRGTLGPYGSPELKVHPDNRDLSPATDVYSLAALTLALLTGVPLEAERLSAMDDDRVTWAVEEALVENPHDRTQTIDEYLENLGHGDEFDLDTIVQWAEELDFKAAVAAVMVLGFGTIGVLYYMQQSGGGGRARASEGSPSTGAPGNNGTSQKKQAKKANTERGSTSSGENTKTLAPGPTQDDPRITIATSFRHNPSKTERPARNIDDLETKLETLRNRARDKIEEAEGLVDEDQKSLYKEALVAVNRAIKLQGGDISTRDQKLLDELYAKEEVEAYYENLIEDIEASLESSSVGNGNLQYQQLEAISPEAKAGDFFNAVKSVEVETIQSLEEDGDD